MCKKMKQQNNTKMPDLADLSDLATLYNYGKTWLNRIQLLHAMEKYNAVKKNSLHKHVKKLAPYHKYNPRNVEIQKVEQVENNINDYVLDYISNL